LLVDLLFLAAKVVADYADCDEFGKAKFTFWVALQPAPPRPSNHARPM
jgi:hypothetical protein